MGIYKDRCTYCDEIKEDVYGTHCPACFELRGFPLPTWVRKGVTLECSKIEELKGLEKYSLRLRRSTYQGELGLAASLVTDQIIIPLGHSMRGFEFPDLEQKYDRLALLRWLTDLHEELYDF